MMEMVRIAKKRNRKFNDMMRVAAAAGIFTVMPVSTLAPKWKELNSGAEMRVQESLMISARTGADPVSVDAILQISTVASETQKIPRAFTTAQMFMESGVLQRSAPKGAYKFNFGGIKDDGGIKRFRNLDEFASDYISILNKDGIRNVTNCAKIIDTLDRKHYFYNESASSYYKKIDGVLGVLQNVSPEYADYRDECRIEMKYLLRGRDSEDSR